MTFTAAMSGAGGLPPTAMFSLQLLKCAWSDLRPFAQALVPPLLGSEHKGSMGRVGVVGGSREYTGAPYYAGISALRFGADLSWVFCSKLAAQPIKSYSPELMVSPFYNDDDDNVFRSSSHSGASYLEYSSENFAQHASTVIDVLPRIHSLVIGPGLGRSDPAIGIVTEIMKRARDTQVPMVIDADGLWIVTNNLALIIGCHKCILTPNKVEFDRLVAATIDLYASLQAKDKTDDLFVRLLNDLRGVPTSADGLSAGIDETEFQARRVRALSVALGGVTVLRKGAVDLIANGGDTVYAIASSGSPRRCGGQGDILAGSLGVALHWGLKRVAMLPDLLEVPMLAGVQQQSIACFSEPMSDNAPQLRDVAITAAGSGTSASPNEVKETQRAATFAAFFAATVTKTAGALAFAERGRSMTAPDVLEQLGRAFVKVHPEG